MADAEEQDERVHREEIAGEERSAEDGEGDPVGEEDDGDGLERAALGWLAGVSGGTGMKRTAMVQTTGTNMFMWVVEMEEAMPETEDDAVGVEVGGGVVAEELGVAEDEAGVVVVVGVPGGEREDGCEEGERSSCGGCGACVVFVAERRGLLPRGRERPA